VIVVDEAAAAASLINDSANDDEAAAAVIRKSTPAGVDTTSATTHGRPWPMMIDTTINHLRLASV